MSAENQITTREPTALASPVPATDWWVPKSFDEAMKMAERMAKSELVPVDFRGKPDSIVVAWSLGAPLGLSLLASLRNISVVNGRPSVWGDAALAICRTHPACQSIFEQLDGEGDDMVATCTVKRAGDPQPVVRSFSVGDAKDAGLWGGANVRDADKRALSPWVKYPKRMLQVRARSWALRDAFPDALCGMPITEELRDITSDVTVRDVTQEQPGATATERLKHKLRPPAEKPTEPETAPADAALDPGLTEQDQREDLMFRFNACVNARAEGDEEKAARIVDQIEDTVGCHYTEMATVDLAKLVSTMEAKIAKGA